MIEDLCDRILTSGSRPIRVAIDGVDAAGKTHLADELRDHLSRRGKMVIRASVDGFHRPRCERLRRGPDSPEGYYYDSFDYEALLSKLLDPLGPGGNLRCRRRVFDFRTDRAVDAPLEHAASESILLFDGVFLLRPELAHCWDFSIFVHAELESTLARACQRDVYLFGDPQRTKRRYEERYIPGQRLYLQVEKPYRRASVVVDNSRFEELRVLTAAEVSAVFRSVSADPGSSPT